MIVDRFEPGNLSELIPELPLEIEPPLQALDRLLDDDEIFSLKTRSSLLDDTGREGLFFGYKGTQGGFEEQ